MEFTRFSGNVFADLGFDESEAKSLQLRSSLMIAIEEEIKRRGMTKAQASKLFGVATPRIQDLLASRIDSFTIDELLSMLLRAGAEIDITFEFASEKMAA